MEKIKFSDVANLYLGCKIIDLKGEPDSNICTMETVVIHNTCVDEHGNDMALDEVKPFLRKLESIKDEEKKQFQHLCHLEKEDLACLFDGTAHLTNVKEWAMGVLFLCGKHFDLFSLIENGEAVELKQSNQ